ncbi:MAG: hypothetical protein AAF772_00515 [Acidobacteriota bacterium]
MPKPPPRRAAKKSSPLRALPRKTRPAPPDLSQLRLVRRLTIAVPIAMFVLVALWSVNVPFWDQWDLVPLLEKQADGTLEFHDLWRPHNEHRMPFPKALMLALAQLSGWWIPLETLLGVGMATISLAIVARLLWTHQAQGGTRGMALPPSAALLPIMAVMLFSPAQSEIWLWGWALQLHLTQTSAIAAIGILSLARGRWLPLGIAAGLALVASYSYASGWMVWLAALPLVVVRERARGAIVWLGAAVVSALIYAHDHPLLRSADAAPEPASIIDLGAYVAVFLGSPIFPYHGRFALVVGVLGLGGCVWAGLRLWDRRDDETALHNALPWLGLAALAIGTAVLVAVGRASAYGIGQALSGRYVMLATPLWLGLGGLIASVAGVTEPERPPARTIDADGAIVETPSKSGGPPPLWTRVVGLVMLFVFAAAIAGTQDLRARHQRLDDARTTLVAGDDRGTVKEDGTPLLYPDGARLADLSRRLRTLELAGLEPTDDAPR